MCVAGVIWFLTMVLLGKGMDQVDGLKDKQYHLPRLWIRVITYSIAVIFFNRKFKDWVTHFVTKENLKYKNDHIKSLIQKNYALGFFNSYLGMSVAAFVHQKLVSVCGLLISVLMLKQIILNLIAYCQPKCSMPKIFLAH